MAINEATSWIDSVRTCARSYLELKPKPYQLFCRTWSPAEPPRAIMLIVHGGFEHSGRYQRMAEHFVGLGYTVWAYDMVVGHGKTPGMRGHIESWEDYRADLRIMVESIAKAHVGVPLFVFGHSLGGLVLLNFAITDDARSHVRGIMASNAGLALVRVPPMIRVFSKIFAQIPRYGRRISKSIGIKSSTMSRDPEVVRAYVADPLVHDIATPGLGQEFRRTRADTVARAGELSVPVLIAYGMNDQVSPCAGSQKFFDDLPSDLDKQLHVYPDAYHELHNDLDDARIQFYEDLHAWMSARI